MPNDDKVTKEFWISVVFHHSSRNRFSEASYKVLIKMEEIVEESLTTEVAQPLSKKGPPPKVPPKPRKLLANAFEEQFAALAAVPEGSSGDSFPGSTPANNDGQFVDSQLLTNFTPQSSCPYIELHHRNKNLGEFLRLKNNRGDVKVGDRNKLLLAEEADLTEKTCKIEHTISFIVDNLKDCGGIWPIMFIEKLNRILVRADEEVLKGCFGDYKDESSLLKKLIELFVEEKKCCLLFRFYCLFYNMLNRRIVDPQVLAKNSKFMDKLQMDFQMAAEGHCGCGHNPNKGMDAASSNSEDSLGGKSISRSNMEAEHFRINPSTRMSICSFLLIPLYSELALQSDPLKTLNTNNEKQFLCQLFSTICDHLSPYVFPHGFGDGFEYTNKHVLTHLVISMNLCYIKSEDNLILQVLQDKSHNNFQDLSQFTMQLLTVLKQEHSFLQQGYSGGVGSFLPHAPLGLQLAGCNGPIKLIIDVLTHPGDDFGLFFTRNDLAFILQVATSILHIVYGQTETDPNDKEIKTNCQELLSLCIKRMQTFPDYTECQEIPPTPESDLSSSPSTSSPSPRSRRSRRSNSRGEDGKSKGKQRKSKALWPIEVLLKLFGCSKRPNTISPEVLDIEYLR